MTGEKDYDTLAVKQVDDKTVQFTRKKPGKVVGESTEAVSPDGRTLTLEFKDYPPEGEPMSGKIVFTRAAPGPKGAHAISGGQYNPFGVSPDLPEFPTGAQMISGVEQARSAVREQIGHGADLIKIYADWSYPTLTVEEMSVIVDEAHKAGREVAAHATTAEGIRNAISAGMDSIEHGHGGNRQNFDMMKEKGVYWVPTMGYYFYRVDQVKPEVDFPSADYTDKWAS